MEIKYTLEKRLDEKKNLLKSGHPQRMPKAPYGLSNQYIARKHSFYIRTCQFEHSDAEFGFLTKITTLANQAPDSSLPKKSS